MNDLIDDVNELIRLGVGDRGRLEHIKSILEKNRTLYMSDKKYVENLTAKYLKTEPDSQKMEDLETKATRIDESVFCWKCGSANNKNSNFCNSCGASLHKIGEKEEKIKPIKSHKKSGLGTGKKILIGLGIFFIVIIGGSVLIGGAFLASVGNNNSLESHNMLKSIAVGESQSAGNMQVTLEKLELYDNYAKAFVSVENLGGADVSLYESSTYVNQNQQRFQTQTAPFGSSDHIINGFAIPSGVIEKGAIFLEPWDYEQEYKIIFGGMTNKQNRLLGEVPEETSFTFVIKQTNFQPNAKCGEGTIFDPTTNSCVTT